MNISFEELWVEHKRFIVGVGVGLFCFLIGLSTVSGIETGARRKTQKNLQTERNVESLIAELEGREGFADGVRDALADTVGPAIRGSVELAVDERFRLSPDQTEGIVHREALEHVNRARADAERRGVKMPSSLGLDENPPEERVAEQLALLDVTERVITMLGKLRVPRVVHFRPGSVGYVRLLDLPATGGSSEDRDPGGEAKDELVLRRLPLEVGLIAPLENLETFMAGFQRAGSVLEMSGVKITRLPDDTIRLDVELAALALVSASDAHGLEQTRKRDGRRPTTRRPRRRTLR